MTPLNPPSTAAFACHVGLCKSTSGIHARPTHRQPATWLSKPVGFLATCFTVTAGVGVGVVLGFNDHWALVFNLFLSIAALLLAGIILVAGAKDTVAIQVKLDELIRAVDKADDRLIGVDQRSAEELDRLRSVTDAEQKA